MGGRRRFACLVALLLAGCAAAGEDAAGNAIAAANPDAPVSSDDPPPPRPPAGPTADCRILKSEKWTATVVGAAAGSPGWLAVSGTITVSTGGYRIALEAGPVLEIHPPIQQVLVKVTPPTGIATQALVTRTVRGEFPALAQYGAVEVRCGSRTLATIRDIAATR